MKSGRLGLYRDKVTDKAKNKSKEKSKPKPTDIVGKTARLKEVTRAEKEKAISDFKKMKEKNLADYTRSFSKAGMSGKTGNKPVAKSPSGDNIKKSGGKNYNVGVSKGGVSFGEAFKHFKNKGVKEFTWNDKRYTTKTKDGS